MAAITAQKSTLSTMLIAHWEQVNNKFTALAEEFPEAAFESSPVNGTRTAGDVLRHVAFWNQYVASIAAGQQADDSANALPKAEYSTRARVLKALKQSNASAEKALHNLDALDDKLAELAVSFIEHTSEHYGQLVIYARSQGIVPPTSRN